MIYFFAAIFVLSMYAVNISVLPHFFLAASQINLVLPFLTLYALRDKSIFPYILAVLAGLLYDSATVSTFPVFAVTFLLIVLAGKNIFSKITSYGIERTSLLLTVIGFFILQTSNWERFIANYTDLQLYINMLILLIATIVVHTVVARLYQRYFDWVEKTTSERFR